MIRRTEPAPGPVKARAALIVYVWSVPASATTDAAPRVDGGVVRSIA
jgi:hypothetical protein